ncbi:MAG: ChaN family lipoprotein [Deltaproteobacteria bacterium]|nr:ChaN family lipoprotein [Deltaproteobacteria bacterium]
MVQGVVGIFQRPVLFITAFAAFLVLWGCAGMRVTGPPLATIPGTPGHFGIGQILELGPDTKIPFDEFIERLSSRDLIFIGEIHDNAEHHLIQLQILQALVDRCGPITVAMEFFQKPNQEAMDRYVRGELKESAFLEAVDWTRTWGYHYHLYRPLLLAAKERSLKILAINAPAPLVRKVAREGLRGLSAEERSQVAAEIDLGNQAHREYLFEAYREHTHQELRRFQDFYEAQCVWEETMAETLSNHLKEKGGKVLVFAGNGHIARKFGIPDRTVRRWPVPMATVIPYPLSAKTEIRRDTADYVWLTADSPRRFIRFHEQKRMAR